jgi:hypothetical protein
MNPIFIGRFRRQVLCRLGWHGPRVGPTGQSANGCCYCGLVFRPEAWRNWDVSLRDGSVHRVRAINEWHAGSIVVYGDGPVAIDGYTGRVIGEVRVHRDNIVSIVPTIDDRSMPT